MLDPTPVTINLDLRVTIPRDALDDPATAPYLVSAALLAGRGLSEGAPAGTVVTCDGTIVGGFTADAAALAALGADAPAEG